MKKSFFVFFMFLIPNICLADGICKNFSDCIFGMFFTDPSVRILGGWKANNGNISFHFSPRGYVDYYVDDVKEASGYWGAERKYPQLGKMDLNITLELNGKKSTVLFLANFFGTKKCL